MKKENRWALIFFAASVILAVCALVFLLGKDRDKPKIRFANTELVYYPGMEEEKLLEGVYAEDKQDGNISGRVVIEKIVPDREEKRVVVYYAVTDLSGNVDKNSRVFSADFSSEKEEDIGTAGYVETLQIKTMEKKKADPKGGQSGEEIDAESGLQPKQEESPSPTEIPLPTATASPTAKPTAKPSGTAVPVPTRTPRVEKTDVADPEEAPERTEAQEQGDEERKEEEEPTGEEPPVLALNTTEITIKAGEGPAWVNLIQTLSDDKDSYETLFHNLNVSKYDRNTPGSYRVTVSTEDSNGNRSNVSNLIINVK